MGTANPKSEIRIRPAPSVSLWMSNRIGKVRRIELKTSFCDRAHDVVTALGLHCYWTHRTISSFTSPFAGLLFFEEVFPSAPISIGIGIENRIGTAFIDCCEAKLPGQRRAAKRRHTHSLGRQPQVQVKKKRQAAKWRQTIGGERLQLTLLLKSVAPPGLILREHLAPWG